MATGGNATLNDRTGLYISILALALAGYSLGRQVNLSDVMDAKIQSAVATAVASAKIDMQQQASDSKAAANEARINSRVALDKVEDVRAKLAEKGIRINLDGH